MIKPFILNDFKPHTNYVIEASAGTGKTYNIVEIVKKLVNEHQLNLNEILIVTYTNKAAGELRDRIRRELKNQDVDHAPIYTINSFCQHVIKEFGISAALPLSLDVINDEDLKDFAERYVREGEILKDITAFATISKFNFDQLIGVLCAALNKYYLNKKYCEDEGIIQLAEMPTELYNFAYLSLELKKAKTIDDLLEKNESFKNNYLVFKTSKEVQAQDFITELENCFKNSFNFNNKIFKAATKWSRDSGTNDELKKAFDFFYRLKAFLDQEDRSFTNFPDKCKLSSIKYKYLTFIHLKDFYQKWQSEKAVNKNQTFSDMIRFVRESVLEDNSLLKEKLRAKYKYAIIDEFQDTNQMQFDIFSNVFMCDGHNIIVVGDPKQSIYSFQGADIQVYYKAKEEIEKNGGLICDLNTNYRSTADMVDACNKLFQYYRFNGTDFNDCDSLTEESGVGVHKVLYEGKPVKAFWIDDEAELTADAFAKVAVEAVVDCCMFDETGKTKLRVKDRKSENYRNVSFKDFAVLARARSEMPAIEKSMRQVGIPFIRYKDQNLFRGKECADWIALMTAINAPDFTGKNRKAFKKVLFTQFVGYSIKLASNVLFETDDNEPMRLVKKWKQIAIERKWEDLFDDIIVESGIIERMTSLSQIQSLGIYKQISNYCVEYLSNNHSIDELIKQLGKMASGSSGEDAEEGPVVEKSTNFDCVQVMTMHSSKGLQFPIVIGVCGFKNPVTNKVFTYHMHEDGKNRHLLGFDSNDQTQLEELEEWKRLFYVAFTRAQFIMMLPNYNNFSKGNDFLKESITSYIAENQKDIRFLQDSGNQLFALKDPVKKILERGAKAAKPEDDGLKADQDKVLQSLIEKSPKISTYKHSYSSISHAANQNRELEDNVQFEGLEKYDTKALQIMTKMNETINRDFPSGYPKGSQAGSALHEILEKIDFQNHSTNLEHIIVKAFNNQRLAIKDEDVKATKDMIENVLESSLPVINGNKPVEDSFTLSAIGNTDKRVEVEFNFNFHNEKLKNYCNGFIDLVFKRGDYYCVLDWKSDSLNENFTTYASNSELRKHVNESYSIQRVLYSYTLIKWLKGYYKDATEDEIFINHFGGIYYVFLRGCLKNEGNGIYCQTWGSWNELKIAFDEIINGRIGGRDNA